MSKVLLVCGYGVGISAAVAEKFGREGFSVALVARSQERLDAGVKALSALGIKAAPVRGDLADPSACAGVVERARAALGPITAIHWNAYAGSAGDFITADPAAIRGSLDVAVTSLAITVQAALPDLRKADGAAVLVTNGGFGRLDPAVDSMGVKFGAMGLSVANAAKAKLVGLLAERLKEDKVYVGELTVMAMVKGTAFDQGNATLDPRDIANKFWSLYNDRKPTRADFS